MADKKLEMVGESKSVDMAAIVAKGALGAIPFAGGLLAEIVGSLIPGQRLDRLVKFAHALEGRLGDVEGELFAERSKTEEGTDLVEDALHQAARSISDDRRSGIAELLKNGLTGENFDHDGSKKLLWLLSELSDPELIWLVFIGRDYDSSMIETHSEILEWRLANTSSPEEEHDSAALQASWRRRLVDLGLVSMSRFGDDSHPAVRGLEEPFENGSFELTQLGRMLMRAIGEVPAW